MKKLYFLILLCFTTKIISAQTYTPVLDSVNIWTYTGNYIGVRLANPNTAPASYPPCGYPNFAGYNLYQQTTNDTVINLVTYRKLEEQYCLFGYLREDTAAKKIFFLDNIGSPEVLLYDFSMQVGDSIPVNFPFGQGYFNSGNFRLDSTAQMYINGVYRTVFYLNNHLNGGATLSWIEGVGNQVAFVYPYWGNQSSGMLFYSCPGYTHDAGQLLTCFNHTDKVYYDSCALYQAMHNASCVGYQDSCDYGNTCSGVNELSVVSSFRIYPNPAAGKTTLLFDLKEQERFTIIVRDISGKQLLPGITLGMITAGRTEAGLDLGALPDGFYLLECKGEHHDFYGKLLIQR